MIYLSHFSFPDIEEEYSFVMAQKRTCRIITSDDVITEVEILWQKAVKKVIDKEVDRIVSEIKQRGITWNQSDKLPFSYKAALFRFKNVDLSWACKVHATVLINWD